MALVICFSTVETKEYFGLHISQYVSVVADDSSHAACYEETGKMTSA